MPFAITHSFIVHFAISLSFLFGVIVLFPKLKEKIPLRVSWVLQGMTFLFLSLAVFTGALSLWRIWRHTSDIPRQAFMHGGAALSGTVLILMIGRSKRFSAPFLSRPLAVVALLLILSAAALGGDLVYGDHLGTVFRTFPR